MSELTYKKIVDVEQVETLNDAATVFINDNGAMKQVAANEFGLGTVKTVNGVEPDENGNIVVEVPSVDGLATEEYVDEKVDGLGGSGGGNNGMLVIRKNDQGITANMTYAELRALVDADNAPICVFMEHNGDEYHSQFFQYAESVTIYDDYRVDVKFEYHEALFYSDGRIEWASLD